MSLRNIYLTEGLNKDHIAGDKLAIDVAGNLTKDYTVHGSLLLTVPTIPFNPSNIYDYLDVSGNITKTLTVDNHTLLTVPQLTGTILSSVLDVDAYLTKTIQTGGNLLISATPLVTYINNGLNSKINSTLIDAPNGVCPLDSQSKVPIANIPGNLLFYKGMFYENQVPPLQDGIGTIGDVWISAFTGDYNFNQANPLDPRIVHITNNSWVIYNGSLWQVNIGADDGVIKFNSRSGEVLPLVGDYSSFYPLISDTYTKTQTNTQISNAISLNNFNYYTSSYIDTNFYTKTNIDTNIYTKIQSDNRYLQLAGGTVTGNLQIDGTLNAGLTGSNINLKLNNTTNTTGAEITLKSNATTTTGLLFNAPSFSTTAGSASFISTYMMPNTQNDMASLIGHNKTYIAFANTGNVIYEYFGEKSTIDYGNFISTSPVGDIDVVYNLYLKDQGSPLGTITDTYNLYCATPINGINRMSAYFGRGVGVGVMNYATDVFALASLSIKSLGALQTNTLEVVTTSSFLGAITGTSATYSGSITGTSATFSSPIICNAINSTIGSNVQNLVTLNYLQSNYTTTSGLSNYVLKSGSTMTGLLVLSADPSASMNPVTLNYLQTNYSTTTTNNSNYVAKAGSTMTGLLVLSADPSVSMNPVTLNYLQTNYSTTTTNNSNYVAKAGSTMTGLLVLSADPSVSMNPVTLNYLQTNYSTTTTNNSNYVAKAGSTMTGLLVLSADPSASMNPVTLNYLQTNYSTTTTNNSNYVAKAGSTMTGLLVLSADPSVSMNPVTLNYLQTNYSTTTTNNSNYVAKAGSTMTGLLVLSGNPTSALNPVTLQYLQANYNTISTDNATYVNFTSNQTISGIKSFSNDSFLNLTATNGGIKFSNNFSEYPTTSGTLYGSEISNNISAPHQALMIVGNKSAGGSRIIKMWDVLNVMGNLNVSSNSVFTGTVTSNNNLYIVSGGPSLNINVNGSSANMFHYIKTDYTTIGSYLFGDLQIGSTGDQYKMRSAIYKPASNILRYSISVSSDAGTNGGLTEFLNMYRVSGGVSYIDSMFTLNTNNAFDVSQPIYVAKNYNQINSSIDALSIKSLYNEGGQSCVSWYRYNTDFTTTPVQFMKWTVQLHGGVNQRNFMALRSMNPWLEYECIQIEHHATTQNIWFNFGSSINLNGPTTVQTSLNVGNDMTITGGNGIAFRKNWDAYTDSNPNASSINNDTNIFKKLMLVGNKSAGGVREVGVWDNLTVNGYLTVASNSTTTGIASSSGLYSHSFNMETINHPKWLVLPYYTEANNMAFEPFGLIQQGNYLELQYNVTGQPASIPVAGVTNLVYSCVNRSLRSFCNTNDFHTGNYYYYCFQFKSGANISALTEYMCGISTRPQWIPSPDNLKYGICEVNSYVTQIIYGLKVTNISGTNTMQETTTTGLSNNTATTLNTTSLYNVYVFWNWDGNGVITAGCAYQNATTGAVVYSQNKTLPGGYTGLGNCPDISPLFEIMGNAQLSSTQFIKFSVIKNISRTYLNNVFGVGANANRINIFD